eukprot:m.64612 g.64612  ORF g.64612 m.64612 type:complete len:399 (+) comp11660_c0_seq2:105-1301(+)
MMLHSLVLPVLLLCSFAAVCAITPKNFGKGLSQGHIHLEEETFYVYNVTQHDGFSAALTHFWITGGTYMCGDDKTACDGSLAGAGVWNPFVDFVVFRYYIDGETNASIVFSPNMACGVGPFANRTESSNSPPSGPSPFSTKTNETNAPWSSKYFGKGSADGGWFLNVKVPFQRSIKVTYQLPPIPGHPEVTALRAFVQVRGVESLPITYGGIQLPSSARLHLQRIEAKQYQALDWVNLLDVPKAYGAILMNTLAVETASLNFMEGCVHVYSPYDAPFPGLIIATGTEDYYNSAYYFSAGQFTFAEVGQTWVGGGWTTENPGQWSAYRIHDEGDPQFFSDGVKLVWRVGDSQKNIDGVLYKCLAPPGCNTTTCPPAGSPTNATVWSYTWYYTWPKVDME